MSLDWSKYPDFEEHEFACKCGCGRADMDPEFMERLQSLRTRARSAITISSGFRCEEHNARIGGGPAHPLGKAADLRVSGGRARKLLAMADAFPRVGVKQTGDHDRRFLHLDILTKDDGVKSPWVWSYK